MKRSILILALVIVATKIAFPACIEDSYSETNFDSDLNVFTVARTGVGQSFTASYNGSLTISRWYLIKTGAPTGNAVSKLYAHSGTYGTSSVPTGAALATSDNFNVATLSAAVHTLVPFTFSTPVSLVSGTNYVITVEYTGGDASNFIGVGSDNSSPTHGGNASSLNVTWLALATRDCNFYVESCLTTLPGPFFYSD